MKIIRSQRELVGVMIASQVPVYFERDAHGLYAWTSAVNEQNREWCPIDINVFYKCVSKGILTVSLAYPSIKGTQAVYTLAKGLIVL